VLKGKDLLEILLFVFFAFGNELVKVGGLICQQRSWEKVLVCTGQRLFGKEGVLQRLGCGEARAGVEAD
jgi:hypothetical protein